MSDAQKLAGKVLLYLGARPEDALMTFAEDGSTHAELLEMARKVQDSAQLTIEKALQIETDSAGRHRCVNCGQLKPASELYRSYEDWACVSSEHCGPYRDPVREDYEELSKSFAFILFQSFQVRAVMDQQPIQPPELREYFASHPAAYHLLRSLVATAMQSRACWGMSRQQRDMEDARRQIEVQRAIDSLLGVQRQSNELLNITAAHMKASATPPSFGYRCPFCFAVTDPEGLSCSSCGEALRPLEPPK